jgi:ketosteroid isomerase-like protein
MISPEACFRPTFGLSKRKENIMSLFKTKHLSIKLTGVLCQLATTGYSQMQLTHNINQSTTNNMKNEAQQVVTDFLNAVKVADIEQLNALLHPDVQWSQPGNSRISGIKHSSNEVFQMVGKMFELSANTLKLTDIKSICVSGNKVACLLHWNAAQPAGGILDVDNIDVYTVENGKIIKVEVFTADEPKEEMFWGD